LGLPHTFTGSKSDFSGGPWRTAGYNPPVTYHGWKSLIFKWILTSRLPDSNDPIPSMKSPAPQLAWSWKRYIHLQSLTCNLTIRTKGQDPLLVPSWLSGGEMLLNIQQQKRRINNTFRNPLLLQAPKVNAYIYILRVLLLKYSFPFLSSYIPTSKSQADWVLPI